MRKQLEQVREFYTAFGDEDKIKDLASIFGRSKKTSKEKLERFKLRERLQKEELDETFDTNSLFNEIEIMDGLGDQLYILFGTILELGLEDRIEAIFADIHASNMSKLCFDQEEASRTIADYANKDIMTYSVELDSGYFAVKRQSDDKILKSINYRPVNLKKYLNSEWIYKVPPASVHSDWYLIKGLSEPNSPINFYACQLSIRYANGTKRTGSSNKGILLKKHNIETGDISVQKIPTVTIAPNKYNDWEII